MQRDSVSRVIWTPETSLGLGIDTFSTKYKTRAFTGGFETDSLEKLAQGRLEAFERVITSRQEYASALNRSMSVKAAGWGASASASYSLLEQASVTSTGVLCVMVRKWVDAHYVVPGAGLDKLVFTDHAARLLRTNVDQFHELYGDSFVVGYETSAELAAFLKVDTTSSQSQRDVAAQLNVSWKGTVSGNAAASLQSHMQSFQSNYSLESEARGHGIKNGPIDISSVDRLREAAIQISNNPQCTRVAAIVIPYAQLAQYRQLVSGNNLELAIDDHYLERLNETFHELRYLNLSIKNMLIKDVWSAGDRQRLQELLMETDRGINELKRLSRKDARLANNNWEIFSLPAAIEGKMNEIKPLPPSPLNTWRLTLAPFFHAEPMHVKVSGDLDHALALKLADGNTMRLVELSQSPDGVVLIGAIHNCLGHVRVYPDAGSPPPVLTYLEGDVGGTWDAKTNTLRFDKHKTSNTPNARIKGNLHGGVEILNFNGTASMRLEFVKWIPGKGFEFKGLIHNNVEWLEVYTYSKSAPVIEFFKRSGNDSTDYVWQKL